MPNIGEPNLPDALSGCIKTFSLPYMTQYPQSKSLGQYPKNMVYIGSPAGTGYRCCQFLRSTHSDVAMMMGVYLEGCQRLGDLVLEVWSILVTQQLIRVVLILKVWQPQPIG